MSLAAPSYVDYVVPRFAELSTVRLARDITANDWDGIERVFPVGAAGTVVGVYRVGYAYEVEFDAPFAALVTLVDDDLTGGEAS